MKPEGYRAFLWGGLIAGILDLTAAIIITVWFGRTPVQLLQLVASGLLGAEAYAAGFGAALLGAFLHFLIAFTVSAIYYLFSTKFTALRRNPILMGTLYGIAVFHVMNFVVLPLSAYPHPILADPTSYFRGILVHIGCIGLPIAFTIHHFAKRQSKTILTVTS